MIKLRETGKAAEGAAMFFGLVMIPVVLTSAVSWCDLPWFEGPAWLLGACAIYLIGSHCMSNVYLDRPNKEASELEGHFCYCMAGIFLLLGFPRIENTLPAFVLISLATPPAAGLLWLEPVESENPRRRFAVWGFCGLAVTFMACTSGPASEIYFYGYPALLINVWAFSQLIPALRGPAAPRPPTPKPMEFAVELLESQPGESPASPAESPAEGSSPEPVLLASGAFRVDKPRALEMLSEFQLKSPPVSVGLGGASPP